MTVTTMHHCARPPRPSGFALIEALIAVVVLATGLLALTALQGALTRSSADSKARSQVAAYVASEMDRIRTGESVAAKSATTTGTNPISVAARAAGLSSLSQTVTSQTFYADAAGSFDTLNPNTGKNARFERIRLNMAWTDATGAGRGLSMTTDISPLALVSSKVLVDRKPLDPNQLRPIVRRPSPVTEGMIPIALGDGQETAATNPKPELVGRSDNTLVSDTRFEVLTFGSADAANAGFSRFNKRIETAVVGCTCQTGLDGFPTGGSAPAINSLLRAAAFRPSYWDGNNYIEPTVASYPVASSPATGQSQSQLCDVCCRDHRDPDRTAPLYANQLSSHDHYLDIAASPVTGGNYVEACRVIRTNGVWRVTPDPKAEDLSLLATQVYPSTTGSSTAPADNNRATTPLVSQSGKDSYLAYAYDFIKTFFTDNTTFDRQTLQETNGLNAPDYVPIKPGDTRWLHARAVLVDYLETDAAERIAKAEDECTVTSVVGIAQCVLPHVPMASVNVTELANWSGQEVAEAGVPLSGAVADPSVIKNYGQALLRLYASAVALAPPVNPVDDDEPRKDEQTFALVPPTTKSGTWLSVASTPDVLFGDPLNPSRGFATLAGAIPFNIVLDGLPNASDTKPANDPSVNVGTVSPQPCNAVNQTFGGNPFGCSSDSASNVTVAVGVFNFLKTANGNINDPCNNISNDKIGEGQAVCPAYALSGGTLVSGTAGKPSEISSVTLPSVAAGSSYTLTFTKLSEANATAVCSNGQFTGWTCD